MKLTLKPTSDSNIYSELWMPTDNWNGKLLVVGNGGFAGSIQGYGDMQVALRLGYATAGTDTVTTAADGPNGMFALGHPEKIVDFAYRALHDTTVESKRLDQDHATAATSQCSYYKGCSTGGRHGHHGGARGSPTTTTASSPARSRTATSTCTRPAFARQVELARNPDMALSPEKAQMVNDAVMNKCDTLHEASSTTRSSARSISRRSLCKGAEIERVPDAAAAQGRRDVLRRREEQERRSDLRGPGARQPADAACAATRTFQHHRHGAHLGIPERRLRLAAPSTSIATCRSSTRRSASSTRPIPI